jgi:predicted TIM-barrel fold metal-dependent hydrolase
MIDGMFVFDCVVHAYDLSRGNLKTGVPTSEHGRHHLQLVGEIFRPVAKNDDKDFDYEGPWSPEDMYRLVFERSPTDMAMAQVVPIFDWFKSGFAPVQAQYEFAKAYPKRVLFCGGADPSYNSLQDALDQIDYQVKELGARSMKFYNAHIEGSWRCDDEEIAYPLYERCRSLGIDVIQFHKGTPFGMHNVEKLRPIDIQAPARDFPDMKFIIHHLALPYFDECVSIGSRFPNVYLALSGNIAGYLLQPRLFQKQLGELLLMVGSNKLLWGSEAALIGSPMPYLKAFMDLEIPEDLQKGYGFPPITREDKEKILGKNFAGLMGIDIEAKKRELAASPQAAE